MHLTENIRLRVTTIDFAQPQIILKNPKSNRDRRPNPPKASNPYSKLNFGKRIKLSPTI